jgi:adenylate kinase
MNDPIIILLGPPGAGKGTQARLLQEKLDLDYFGSGEILRKRKLIDDFTGRKIQKKMDDGELLASPIMIDIWINTFEEIKKNNSFRGIIMDGSPRRLHEAQMLEQALDWYEWNDNKKAIFVNLSEQDATDRLTKRRVCTKCKKNIPYVGEYKIIEACDVCGGELIKRADDEASDIVERFKWYASDVLPTVDFYRKQGTLIEVNGDQSIEDVHKEIMEKLE